MVITDAQTYTLLAGSSMAFEVMAIISAAPLAGTAVGTVSIGVIGDERASNEPGLRLCDEYYGHDVTFDVALTTIRKSDLNELGNIRFVGLALMVVVWLTALGCAVFVLLNRNAHIVKVMQPKFLLTLCAGVFIMSTGILPRSFDDSMVSEERCSRMCAALPWLLSTGSCIVFRLVMVAEPIVFFEPIV